MASVTVGTVKNVQVLDEDCPFRACFRLGFDKGSFTPGVGYTSYHSEERPVCFTRHLNGCPHIGAHLVCGHCHARLAVAMADEEHPDPPERCPECGADDGDFYWLSDVLLPVEPCCEAPDVPATRPGRPVPHRQKCRSCGATLRGARLEAARGR